MSNDLISIIVPIYNVEKYLRPCLESINNQTYKNYEAILVDDASTDNGLQIAKEFCEINSNFKLIAYNEQIGVSHARKKAIELSNGKYLAFLDGDDTMEPQFLEKMYSTMLSNNADVVYCNYSHINAKTSKKKTIHVRKPIAGVKTGRRLAQILVADWSGRSYLWNKLWKKSLFENENLTFPNMYYEDLALSALVIHGATKTVVINDVLVNYTIKREGSIVNRMSVEKLNDYHSVLYIVRHFFENENDFPYYRMAFFRIAMSMFFMIPYNLSLSSADNKTKRSMAKRGIKDVFTSMSPNYLEHMKKHMPKLLSEDNKLCLDKEISSINHNDNNNVINIDLNNVEKSSDRKIKSKSFDELYSVN